jgi:hypothetical protein
MSGPILTTHEMALNAIAWERAKGNRLHWHPAPFSYVMEETVGELRLMTIVDNDLQPTVEAIRAILHDTEARPPDWIWSRHPR